MLIMVNTFSTWLVEAIQSKGWTQAELARRAGVSGAAISDAISGRRNVGSDLALSIANALRVPPDEVYRIAGILPPKTAEDGMFYKIKGLYESLRDDENKKRALDYIEYLADQEDRNGDGAKRGK